jgi:hypothetical protein
LPILHISTEFYTQLTFDPVPLAAGAAGVDWSMEHLSDWHKLNSDDRGTYPHIAHRVQVRFANGRLEEGDRSMFFPASGVLPDSQITRWRYIKDYLP